ncbi:class I tRNA ligase family protein [Labrys sp. La1]|uniref:class I tRNA ligase family protein n=1 Tax=Labrys sp. La1 TaxID=3404917 RepID=UPI003EB7333D
MSRTFIVTATPPTPNGDFHVGHLSGPYLGADIFSRYQRMRGNQVRYVCSADRNQSYVVTTAERLGKNPDRMATACHGEMRQTLEAADIHMDAFNMVDDDHVAFVQSFLAKVEANGHAVRKPWRFPYSVSEDRYLFESFVSGHCPVCWSPTAGAICEACGHPNDTRTLELVSSSRSAGDIDYREVEIAVLELERFRSQFTAFYESKRGIWRPHVVEFAFEMLSKPLPDYPLTYPSDWGIPAPFAGLEGQVLNVWAEMLPGLINSTRIADGEKSTGDGGRTGLWSLGRQAELVEFLGYDNSFFFTFVHPALAWAHGDCRIVDTILTNEFFELENFKFSTSKGHLIWGRDLLRERDVNAVRFYLALANPEYQKMNFTQGAMDQLVEVRLSRPYKEAASGILEAAAALGLSGQRWRIDERTAGSLGGVLARFARFHEIETFSPQRIAEHLSQLLVRIAAGSRHALSPRLARAEAIEEVRYLAALFQLVLPLITRPLMPAFSDRLSQAFAKGATDAWPASLAGQECQIEAATYGQALAAAWFDREPALRRAS